MMQNLAPTTKKLLLTALMLVVAGGVLFKWRWVRRDPWRGHPAFAAVSPNPALPNVLIIGDSISIGYTTTVREQLAAKANVYRIPENGGSTEYALPRLAGWLGDRHWDVISFNFGLHDIRLTKDGTNAVPVAQYQQNLEQIAGRLQATGARLVWCNTTPVAPATPDRAVEDVPRYNQAAHSVIRQHGIAEADLYTIALNELARVQLPRDVHFNEQGDRLLGEAVAAALSRELPQR